MVAKTISTDVSTSQELIMKAVQLVQENTTTLQYLSRLVDVFDNIIDFSPEIIAQIYFLIFSSNGVGDGLPFFGGSVLLQLVMSSEQVNNHLEYKLAKYLFSFIKKRPNLGVAVGLISLDRYVFREHIDKKYTYYDETDTSVYFRGKEITIVHDRSYMWSERENTYEDTWKIMDSAIFGYVEHLIKHKQFDDKIRDYILDLFRDRVQVCYLWMRFIEIASKYPPIFAEPLFELISNQYILYRFDLLYQVGHFLTTATPYYTENQMQQLEEAIFNGDITKRDHTKYRLIASIPTDRLITQKAKLLKAEIEESDKTYTEPLFSFGVSVQPYDEDADLQERGINLKNSGNDIIHALYKQLRDAHSNLRDKSPNLETVGDILSVIEKLHSILQQTELEADKQVKDLAWTYLGETVAELCASLEYEEPNGIKFKKFYTMFKIMMLNCANYDYPDLDRDIPYNHPGWSPTPRTSAVIGLLALSHYSVDKDVLMTIEQLRDNTSPQVRFLVAHRLGLVFRLSPEFYWYNAEKIIANEENSIILQGLYSNLIWDRIIQDKRAQTYIYKAFRQLLDGEFDDELARILTSVMPNQIFMVQSEWSIDIASRITQNPIRNSKHFSLLVWNVLRYIQPSDKHKQALSRTITWVERITEITKSSLFELADKAMIDGWNDEVNAKFNELQRTLDNIVHQLYFRLGVETDDTINKKTPLPVEQQKAFYSQVKNILLSLSQLPNNGKIAIMSPHTVDDFMKIMLSVVGYDPSTIIQMVSNIIKSSQTSNYQFDDHAIKKFVALVDRVFVDYPETLKNQEDMTYILETIEIFINAGRLEAFKLLQRLPEIFR